MSRVRKTWCGCGVAANILRISGSTELSVDWGDEFRADSCNAVTTYVQNRARSLSSGSSETQAMHTVGGFVSDCTQSARRVVFPKPGGAAMTVRGNWRRRSSDFNSRDRVTTPGRVGGIKNLVERSWSGNRFFKLSFNFKKRGQHFQGGLSRFDGHLERIPAPIFWPEQLYRCWSSIMDSFQA